MRVLAIGECMAELAPSHAPDMFNLGFAGDTFNTAWYLAQLAPDIGVSYYSCVGDDALSHNLMAFMEKSKIDTSAIQSLPNKTIGLYLISLENGERSFSYWRGQSAARCLADHSDHLEEAIASADVIYFSGITLGILTPDRRKAFLSVLRSARARGKTVAFDPNLRPKLWVSGDEMTTAIMEGAAVCDIALPSFEDEASWFHDATPNATAERYLNAGAKTIIVKNGAEAVHFAHGNIRGDVAVEPVVDVVDTTAAGDSFNAGFFADFLTESALEDAIKRACHLSRRVVQHKGALMPV